MIDIHTHILPGVDDGSRNMEESLAIARVQSDAGTRVVFATPHMATPEEFRLSIPFRQQLKELQARLDSEGILIQLYPGAEAFPSESLIVAVDEGLPVCMGESRYLLVGPPILSIPLDFGRVIFELQSRGITPILAHPERVQNVQENPGIMEEYLQRGMLMQVNAGSVLGQYGQPVREAAEVLLRHGWVHFLASDAHRASSRSALASAASALEKTLGRDLVDELTEKNPRVLLDGGTIRSEPAEYRPPTPRSPWRLRNPFARR